MKKLKFKEDGTFKIMQLTDIHYEDKGAEDQKTLELVKRLIAEEQPDFIMITGDVVYGEQNRKNLKAALEPVAASHIPWSFVFGNHDTENGEGYEALYGEIQKQPGCIAYHDESSGDGIGNHVVKILGKDGKIKWVLFGLDSGNYNPIERIGGYDYLKASQISWYREQIGKLEKERENFSALAFFHIALCEFRDVWDYEICYGEKNEGVCCGRINSGMFAAMQEAGHTKGVFVGHDHVNSYYGELYGITLGYGRGTGYNTYGKEGFERGARIFILREDDLSGFHTYEHLADGQRIEKPVCHLPERERERE